MSVLQYQIYMRMSDIEKNDGYMAAVDWLMDEIKGNRVKGEDGQAALEHLNMAI